MKKKPVLINGQIQHYVWGGTELLPKLLNLNNDQKDHYAELWFGTHPLAPALLPEQDGILKATDLDSYLKENPQFNAGHSSLSYLLKVLEVANPLSIQVHPNKNQAEAGFLKENELNIPLNAPHRNYKDDNHKPEIMVALNDCYLLYGFSDTDQIKQRLQQHPSLTLLIDWLTKFDFKEAYQLIMGIDSLQKEQLIAPLLKTLLPKYHQGTLDKNHHDYWVAKAALAQVNSPEEALTCRDPGLLSIYTMNVVNVPQGKGIFQPAQLPHAYLEGGNIELMANSDNVLRAGLTPKHVDVEELLEVTHFEVATPQLIEATLLENGWSHYPNPSKEFELYHLKPIANHFYFLPEQQEPRGQILLNIGMPCKLLMNQTTSHSSSELMIGSGEAAFIPNDCICTIQSDSNDTLLFLAH